MYVTLKVENLRLRYSNSRNTIIACLLFGVFCILLNFPNKILDTFDIITPINSNNYDAFNNNNNNSKTIENICKDTKIDENLTLFYTKVTTTTTTTTLFKLD